MTSPDERQVKTALSIAGSDPSGGAGIQADLKTFSALGVYGLAAVTALTAQNTQGVQAVRAVPASFVRQQIESVLSDIRVDAVKIGMLGEPDIVQAVCDVLKREDHGPVILDPVMVATSGDVLLSEKGVRVLTETLMPLADLVTPNIPEARALLGRDDLEPRDMALALLDLGAKAALVKGGHGERDICTDYLALDGRVEAFSEPRVRTGNTHGTGCTLSSAVAAFMARGYGLEESVCRAKVCLTAALKNADRLGIGQGCGPVHHFYDVWSVCDA